MFWSAGGRKSFVLLGKVYFFDRHTAGRGRSLAFAVRMGGRMWVVRGRSRVTVAWGYWLRSRNSSYQFWTMRIVGGAASAPSTGATVRNRSPSAETS